MVFSSQVSVKRIKWFRGLFPVIPRMGTYQLAADA